MKQELECWMATCRPVIKATPPLLAQNRAKQYWLSNLDHSSLCSTVYFPLPFPEFQWHLIALSLKTLNSVQSAWQNKLHLFVKKKKVDICWNQVNNKNPAHLLGISQYFESVKSWVQHIMPSGVHIRKINGS